MFSNLLKRTNRSTFDIMLFLLSLPNIPFPQKPSGITLESTARQKYDTCEGAVAKENMDGISLSINGRDSSIVAIDVDRGILA